MVCARLKGRVPYAPLARSLTKTAFSSRKAGSTDTDINTMKPWMKNITFKISMILSSLVPTSCHVVESMTLNRMYMKNLNQTTAGFLIALMLIRQASTYVCQRKGVCMLGYTKEESLLPRCSAMLHRSALAASDVDHAFMMGSTRDRSLKEVSTSSRIHSIADVIGGKSQLSLLSPPKLTRRKCSTARAVGPAYATWPELSSRKSSDKRNRRSLG
mmetsp:Transcript_41229/g.78764  ORF Transcript_41229/g.78764 Transcript_41229/m.78764 type:complete len:215 (-) Transcript_41229:26-670(-)